MNKELIEDIIGGICLTIMLGAMPFIFTILADLM